MVRVTSPGVTPTDKQKCLAAVQKRGEFPEPSSSSKETVHSDQKPVISVTVESALPNSVSDVTMLSVESHSRPEDNENKIRIKIETEENMEVDVTNSVEHVETETIVKMEKEPDVIVQNSENLEVTDIKIEKTNETDNQTVVQSKSPETGLETVSEAKTGAAMETDIEADCETKVQIQVSVPGETEGTNVTVPSTVAQTDVTKPLTIQTKFTPNTSPGKHLFILHCHNWC